MNSDNSNSPASRDNKYSNVKIDEPSNFQCDIYCNQKYCFLPLLNNAWFYFKKTICKTVTNPYATDVIKVHVCYTFKKMFI